MKVCTKCKVEKPFSEFSKSGFKKNGDQAYKTRCKQCLAIEDSNWYWNGGGLEVRNKKFKEDQASGKRQKRIEIRRAVCKEIFICVRGGKCEMCGTKDPPNGWNFDHIDPQLKEHEFNAGNNYEVTFRELEKCQLLCTDCHLEKTKEDYLNGRIHR